MDDLMQFVFRDGTGEDAFIGWLMIALAGASAVVGGWLWLDWGFRRRMARARRETRAVYLKMLEAEEVETVQAEDQGREKAWITISNR